MTFKKILKTGLITLGSIIALGMILPDSDSSKGKENSSSSSYEITTDVMSSEGTSLTTEEIIRNDIDPNVNIESHEEIDQNVSYKELASLEYSGVQTIEINGNVPTFTESELSLSDGSWATYGDLDGLNRVTQADAMLNQSLMPTEKRESISSVTPTGWKNKKLKSGYLYNRSHLIGFALAGENANWKNLMTGTRQLNSPEMLRFEMDIKNYLEKDSNNYVRYSVTPVFRGDELVARGVHLMALSVNDNSISFNVFIHNIQDGVTIDYSDGSSVISNDSLPVEKDDANDVATDNKDLDAPVENNSSIVYITKTGKKYHLNKDCRGLNNAKVIIESNLEEATQKGLTICDHEK